MTDHNLQKLMYLTHKIALRHYYLLTKLRSEYIKRFGSDPSVLDDELFVDTFENASFECITVKEMTENVLNLTK